MYPVKQSTALDLVFFAHDANGDAVTGKVDGDFTKRISKNGAAFGAMTVTITEREGGWYHMQLSTSHTDTLGVLTVYLTASGIKQVNTQFRVHARINDDLAYPTVSGRSLDVTATGAAGIDWANVENPTTAVNLSATNIDVDQVVASVSGNVTGSVGSVAAGGITASSIATGAIDADALATDAVDEIVDAVWNEDATAHQTQGTFGQVIGDSGADADSIWSLANTNLDATVSSRLAPTVAGRTLDITATGTAGIDWANVEGQSTIVNLSATNIDVDQVVASVTGSVGSVTGNVGGNVVGSVGSVTGNVGGSVGSVAAGGITAASIATDAIDGDAIAASAVTEIQSGLSTLTAGQVNAEVVDALNVDTYTEPVAVPAATATITQMLHWIFTMARNKRTTTSTTDTLRNDADNATIAASTISDDGTTFTRGEYA